MSGTYINVDFGNLFFDFEAEDGSRNVNELIPMNEDGLRQEIDYYAAKGVSAILFNLNAMRAAFDSHTFDPIWKGLEEKDGKYFYRGKEVGYSFRHSQLAYAVRCRELYRNVPDPQKVRYAYCRQKGVDMFISMRMNDVHFVAEPDLICHGDFWREYPEYRRAMFKKDYTFWFSQCFDYGKPEVYEHHMALVREYFERFNMDGFELDWMRSPFFFRPGEVDKGREILTEFMREVRRIADQAEKKRGHRIRIAVRIPSWPEDAFDAGLDTVRWAKEGLTDIVVPSPYFGSNDPTTPIEIWKMLLPENVELAPCMDCQLATPKCSTPKSPELDAGLAANFYYRGADSIYLFNHMLRNQNYGQTEKERMREYYTILSDKNSAYAVPRRHPVAFKENHVEGKCPTPPFPPEIPPKGCVPVRLHVGGGTAGRKTEVYLAFMQEQFPQALKVFLNGTECRFMPDHPPYHDQTEVCIADYLFKIPGKFFFEVPDGVLHDGVNQIDLINAGEATIPLAWVEIAIK